MSRKSAVQPETILLREIQLALGAEPGLVLWRNSTGLAEHWDDASMRLSKVRYGLVVGGSDLIGILSYPILVGGRFIALGGGRFIALEVKTATGRVTPEQDKFLALVRTMGGFAAVVRSVDESRAALERARRGANE